LIEEDEKHDAEYQARKNGVENYNTGVGKTGGLFTDIGVKGDEKMGKMPFKDSIRPPSDYVEGKHNDNAPDAELE